MPVMRKYYVPHGLPHVMNSSARCLKAIKPLSEKMEKLYPEENASVSLSRALLKDAPIILLDEATASLDVENETKIQAGISELVRDKTVLIIAHRMRTVVNADNIIVLKDGQVVERGSAEYLKKQKGIFAKLLHPINL